jgi:hypothetical protein
MTVLDRIFAGKNRGAPNPIYAVGPSVTSNLVHLTMPILRLFDKHHVRPLSEPRYFQLSFLVAYAALVVLVMR